MRNDFCAMILTHGRPANVWTDGTLRRHGYTGPIRYVVDDQDPTRDEYLERFGDEVIVFSKQEAAAQTDRGDNFPGLDVVVFARNICFEIARDQGFRFFVQLDDDYTGFYYRFGADGRYGVWKLSPIDWLFSAMCDYLAATPFASVALSQGGDHIGGGESQKTIRSKRKAMNSFVCDVESPFRFHGRINEDVSTTVVEQRRGVPFLTLMAAQLNQATTQSRAGGLTEPYLRQGTYVKSFYSVLYAPSCVTIFAMGDPRIRGRGYRRLHHRVNWNAAAPRIVREIHRKPRSNASPDPSGDS